MQGSRIYSDFADEIEWIREAVASDISSLSTSMRPMARFYTSERLKILPTGSTFRLTDPRMGRPVPYAAFWFAHAFGLPERLGRASGLSLVYSSLATTLRDDAEDMRPAGDGKGKIRLAEFWEKRYLDALKATFPSQSSFVGWTSWAEAEWGKYRAWNSARLGDSRLRPFTPRFLGESSRYFVAVVLPSLSALACAAGKEAVVPRIERFLRNFSMGWRIFDDLMDWEKDLGSGNLNRSSVLHYIRASTTGGALDRYTVLSWFMSKKFIEDAYGAMLRFFVEAQRDATGFRDRYLDQFMSEQVGFQKGKREELLGRADSALLSLSAGLSSVIPP